MNLVNTSEITVKTADEVKTQVEELISRYHSVVSGREEAETFFNECKIEGYLYSEEAQRFTVEGERNGDYQESITVVITAFYKDPGSVDYCYSVTVIEY